VRLLIEPQKVLLVILPSFKRLCLILTESAGGLEEKLSLLFAVTTHWITACYYFASFFGVPFGGTVEAKFGWSTT
jgi:hypothetical protein